MISKDMYKSIMGMEDGPVKKHMMKMYHEDLTKLELRPNDPIDIQQLRYDVYEAKSRMEQLEQEKFFPGFTGQVEIVYWIARYHDKRDELKNRLEQKSKSTQDTLKSQSNNFMNLSKDKKTIQIGKYIFNNFTDFLNLLRIKDNEGNKKSQIKGGVMLIYAICRYVEEKTEQAHMLISDLIEYYEEFKQGWGYGLFEKKGRTAKSISKTACESANTILIKCALKTRFKLSKDKKEILLTP